MALHGSPWRPTYQPSAHPSIFGTAARKPPGHGWVAQARASRRWAVVGAVVGATVALVAFAPAHWLAQAVASATPAPPPVAEDTVALEEAKKLSKNANDDILKIATNMQLYGGHFAQYIGKALIHADSGNRDRLAQAFFDMNDPRTKDLLRDTLFYVWHYTGELNIEDLRAAGFLKLCVPTAHGGLGADYATYMMVAAEIGRWCGATALSFNMHVCSCMWAGEIADNLDMTTAQRADHAANRALSK